MWVVFGWKTMAPWLHGFECVYLPGIEVVYIYIYILPGDEKHHLLSIAGTRNNY